jgi:RNA polymerase sigma factor (sigma-70 family)
MSDSPSFAHLIRAAQDGDMDQAGQLIHDRLAPRIAPALQRRICARLRERIGVEDVVQSVFLTFMRRLAAGTIQLRDWPSLEGLLLQIGQRRICRHLERIATAKRSQDREVSLETDPVDVHAGSPEDEMVVTEMVAGLLRRLPERYHAIVEALLEERTHEEIARSLGTSISTVERVHHKAREALSAMLNEES